MNRRTFLARATSLWLATLATSCQRAGADSLSLAILANSLPSQVIRTFQQQQGRSVAVTAYPSLLDLFKRLQTWQGQPHTGTNQAGLRWLLGSQPQQLAQWVTLGDFWLKAAIQQALIQPVPGEAIAAGEDQSAPWPQIVRRDSQGYPSDTGDLWGIPYRWSSLAILYDPARLTPQDQPLTRWVDLLRPDLRRRVILPDHPRLVLGIALKAVGASANHPNPEMVVGLQDMLQKLHQQVRVYDASRFLETLIIGDATAVIGWTDDIAPVLRQHQSLKAAIPTEGTLLSADLWVQPATGNDALSPDAVAWANFCLGDDFADQLAIYGHGAAPRWLGQDRSAWPEALQRYPSLILSPETKRTSEFLLPVSPEAEAQYVDIWTALRSNDLPND